MNPLLIELVVFGVLTLAWGTTMTGGLYLWTEDDPPARNDPFWNPPPAVFDEESWPELVAHYEPRHASTSPRPA